MEDIRLNGQNFYNVNKVRIPTVSGGTAEFSEGSSNPYEDIIDNQNANYRGRYLFTDCSDDSSTFTNHFTDAVKSKIKSFIGTFYQCQNLTTIDFTNFTPTITTYPNCKDLFNNCKSLTSIDLSWLTRLGGSENMFQGCASLTSIDLSSADIRQGSRQRMFAACYTLTNLTMPSVYVASITENMFSNCSALINLDLSGLNISTSSPACSTMFNGCSSLQTIIWGGEFKINSTDNNAIDGMFLNCTSLNTINYQLTKQDWMSRILLYATLFDNNQLTQPIITVQCTDGQLVYNNDGSGDFSITENSTIPV